jgi:hypothetical protein
MTRQEKRTIRLEISKTLDTNCRNCKYFSGYNKQICASCPVGISMQELNKKLEIHNKHSALKPKKVMPKPMTDDGINLQSKRRPWTEYEDFYLLNHSKLYTNAHLAEKLNRSVMAVTMRIGKIRKGEVNVL